MCRLLLGLLLAGTLSGCGTVIARIDNNHWTNDTYYKGVQADAKLLTGHLDTGYAPIEALCWISIACPVATIIFMPVDAVIDTVALPFDHR
ncbi:hypothetical protein UB43_03145 [Pseudomonas sp. 21]|uniref:YceK/YidQ family lipoprotein n=1 Tax=unclassified Pseudomonas TaxID=196821 RepID=UPI0005EB9B91|nr:MULTISPECIES: YceK/YidQ family lipoprotein [unclassified Pseudomonas]KJK03509.1 hypothetical protein UB43_03145 [Pseudomonas sp. 21]MBV7585049.1 YceK/YidQ family lipoprotein [Pseudomonas sp. PDM33]